MIVQHVIHKFLQLTLNFEKSYLTLKSSFLGDSNSKIILNMSSTIFMKILPSNTQSNCTVLQNYTKFKPEV